MNTLELEKKKVSEREAEEAKTRRDWDRSEWFRLWLELIRQAPQGAGH
jgi:hypothetical protein